MNKIIRLNERAIKNIVGESLKRVLKENDDLFTRDEFKEKHGFNPNWGGDSKPFSHKPGPGVKFYGSEQDRSNDELYDSAIETIENSDGNVSFDEWFSTYMYDNDIDRDDAEVVFKKAMNDYNGTSHGLNEAKINKIVAKTVRKVLKENAEDEGRFLNWLGLGNRRNAQQPQPVQPQQQIQGKEGEGGTCPKCGNQTRPGARFCNKCGENLTGESSFCKFCGKPKKPEQKFCSHCGKYVGPLNEAKKKNRLNEARFDVGGYSCLVNGGNYVYFDKTSNNGDMTRYYYDIRSNKWPEGSPNLTNVSSEELTNELEKAGLNSMVASRIANRVGARPTQTQSPAQNGAPMQQQSSQGGWTRRDYDNVNKNNYIEVNPQAAWRAFREGKITRREFEAICERNGVDPSRFTYNSI